MQALLDGVLAEAGVPAIVGLVTDPGSTRYLGAAGEAKNGTPFAIMSMTKPVASVAIMRLVENGDIELDAPVEALLPAYADIRVATEVDPESGHFEAAEQDAPFTARQLLAHTAGFGYSFGNPVLAAIKPESDLSILCHQPGERWTYGASTRVLGEMISAVTSQELGEALADLVFRPLGMTSTSFELRDDQAQVYNLENGKWNAGKNYPYMPFADGGLIGTAEDYARFVRCLLNLGEPILSRSTFESMITNQIGELTIEAVPSLNPRINLPFPRGAGSDKWGLGFQLHGSPAPGMRHPGSFSWCGLLNTHFWCDPVAETGGILLMQSLPFYSDPCMSALDSFEAAVYS